MRYKVTRWFPRVVCEVCNAADYESSTKTYPYQGYLEAFAGL